MSAYEERPYRDWYGAEIDLAEFGDATRGHDFRVAVEEVTPDARVSTVFLHGLDHATSGPPLLFETLVFGGALDQTGERFTTVEQARAGHAAMVERVRAAEAQLDAFAAAPEVVASVAVIQSVLARMDSNSWDRERFYGLLHERVERVRAAVTQ